MKQTTYALVVFICLFITAGTVETFPFISFTGLGVMAWAIRKGQLWEYKEKSLPKTRTGTNNNNLTHR